MANFNFRTDSLVHSCLFSELFLSAIFACGRTTVTKCDERQQASGCYSNFLSTLPPKKYTFAQTACRLKTINLDTLTTPQNCRIPDLSQCVPVKVREIRFRVCRGFESILNETPICVRDTLSSQQHKIGPSCCMPPDVHREALWL